MQIQRLLIISAVKEELSPLFNFLKIQQTNNNLVETDWNKKKIFFGFTGIGMINSAVYTSKFIFESKCDFAIQAGIAGCFNYDNKLGDTVEITHEFISEMFAQDGDKNIEMKRLHSDNAKELIGMETRNYLKEISCYPTSSTVYTPKENSFVERSFRHEGEAVSSAFCYSKQIPHIFWMKCKEAFHT